MNCYGCIKHYQNEAILAENLDGLHKDYNYKLCKTALGKDEVAGSNPAISSIEILQINAGFRFFGSILQDLRLFVKCFFAVCFTE